MRTPQEQTPPLGVGLETPLARPLNFPLGCGPATEMINRAKMFSVVPYL